MMNRLLIVGLAAIVALAGCANENKTPVYKNTDFGYSIAYSAGFQAKPIKWVEDESGVELVRDKQTITVQALPTGTDYAALSFDNYVKIAASVDIQNFTRLTAIEPFISAYNVKGYKTFWEVIRHEDTDNGENNRKEIVGPIYYFPLERPRKVGAQPVKAIMINADPALSSEVTEIAASFRYLNSFVTLLRNKQNGRAFLAKKGRLFRVELAANLTTGYNWYITGLDDSRFRVRRSGYDPNQNGRLGGGGTSFWEIVPLREGAGTIKLLYYRAWEGADKAVDQFEIRVLVL